jgi:hypothetical protein
LCCGLLCVRDSPSVLFHHKCFFSSRDSSTRLRCDLPSSRYRSRSDGWYIGIYGALVFAFTFLCILRNILWTIVTLTVCILSWTHTVLKSSVVEFLPRRAPPSVSALTHITSTSYAQTHTRSLPLSHTLGCHIDPRFCVHQCSSCTNELF